MTKHHQNARPRRATVVMVAADAGVSRQTVSNALNAPQRLQPETLARVQRSIQRLGYQPDDAARSLRTRATRRIGYQLPDVGDVDAIDGLAMVGAFCQASHRADFEVVVFPAGDDEHYRDLMRRRVADAFVLTDPHPGPSRSHPRSRGAVPALILGWAAPTPDGPAARVDTDESAGAELAVQHLMTLGHRRIAFLGRPGEDGRDRARYAGWATAAQTHRLPVRGLARRVLATVPAAAAAVSDLLTSDLAPTGLLCTSDVAAAGALLALRQHGLVAGSEFGVVSWGDTPLSVATDPPLTSVRPAYELLAEAAIQILNKSIASGRRPRRGSVLIAPALTVRASSAPSGPAATVVR